MNAKGFFFFFFLSRKGGGWGGGKVPAKIAKLHFIKDLLAMTGGDC